MIYIRQEQPNKNLCVPTAIAILTGISVSNLLADVGGEIRSYAIDEFITPLFRRGWLLAPTYSLYDLQGEGEASREVILTTCPAVVSGILNHMDIEDGTNGYHAVAWTGNSVLDPGWGCEGEKLHTAFKEILGIAHIVPIPMYSQYWTNLQSEVPDWL